MYYILLIYDFYNIANIFKSLFIIARYILVLLLRRSAGIWNIYRNNKGPNTCLLDFKYICLVFVKLNGMGQIVRIVIIFLTEQLLLGQCYVYSYISYTLL